MKYLFITFLLLISSKVTSQNKNEDITNLINLAEIYSKDNNGFGENYITSINKLRTNKLNHIIDALELISKGDERILSSEFLSKPDSTELKYWYVIREIHYNNQLKNKTLSNEEVAIKVLNQNIDEKWLIDNYYYRLHGGFAKIFNEADLSKYNFRLDDYKLKDETEKAILFFNLSNSFIQRFKVLNKMKNPEKLLEFESRLPKFDDRPYFEYASFDFEDFEFIGYDKTESYKKRNLNNLYQSLMSHMVALGELNKYYDAINLYFKSILSKPVYFEFTENLEPELNELYQQFDKKKK